MFETNQVQVKIGQLIIVGFQAQTGVIGLNGDYWLDLKGLTWLESQSYFPARLYL